MVTEFKPMSLIDLATKKLRIGKEYLTREGEAVTIVAAASFPPYIYRASNGGTYTERGQRMEGQATPYDIIV